MGLFDTLMKINETIIGKEISVLESVFYPDAKEAGKKFSESLFNKYFTSKLVKEPATAEVISIVGPKSAQKLKSQLDLFKENKYYSFGNLLNSLQKEASPRIQYIYESDAEKFIPNLEGKVYEGDILFKHPFLPNTYVDAKESEQTFFKQKLDCFSRVCQLLGAKSVTGQGMWVSQQQLTIDADGKVGYKCVELTGNIHTNEKSRLEQSYSLKETFLSSEPNISEAESLAKKYGLYKEMQTLIEGRMYSNSLQSRNVTITLSDELNKEKEIAFSLNATKLFELSGTLKQTMGTVSTVKYEIHVEF